jgi:hypothetical protein
MGLVVVPTLEPNDSEKLNVDYVSFSTVSAAGLASSSSSSSGSE